MTWISFDVCGEDKDECEQNWFISNESYVFWSAASNAEIKVKRNYLCSIGGSRIGFGLNAPDKQSRVPEDRVW